MKIISATTHFNVKVYVEIGPVTCYVNCLVFVPSSDYTDVDVDPDTISDVRLNGLPVDDIVALFDDYKERGISLAKHIRKRAGDKFDVEALTLLISKSHVTNE